MPDDAPGVRAIVAVHGVGDPARGATASTLAESLGRTLGAGAVVTRAGTVMLANRFTGRDEAGVVSDRFVVTTADDERTPRVVVYDFYWADLGRKVDTALGRAREWLLTILKLPYLGVLALNPDE